MRVSEVEVHLVGVNKVVIESCKGKRGDECVYVRNKERDAQLGSC